MTGASGGMSACQWPGTALAWNRCLGGPPPLLPLDPFFSLPSVSRAEVPR